jgi:hypothetical protein
MIRVPSAGAGESSAIGSVVVKEMAVKAEFDATVLKQIESELRSIKAEYRGRLSEESIDMAADESLERLSTSRVPQFVPLFVGRFTRQRLRELVAAGEASAS